MRYPDRNLPYLIRIFPLPRCTPSSQIVSNTDLDYLKSKFTCDTVNHHHGPIYSQRETDRGEREKLAGLMKSSPSRSHSTEPVWIPPGMLPPALSVSPSISCRSPWPRPAHPSMYLYFSHMHTHAHTLGILLTTSREKYLHLAPFLFLWQLWVASSKQLHKCAQTAHTDTVCLCATQLFLPHTHHTSKTHFYTHTRLLNTLKHNLATWQTLSEHVPFIAYWHWHCTIRILHDY